MHKTPMQKNLSDIECLNLFITFTCNEKFKSEECVDVTLQRFWFWNGFASIWGLQCAKSPGSSWLCTWNLTIDQHCQHCDLFCLPLSVPADISTSWIPWLSHREAAEWTANGRTPNHCLSVSDPWRLLSAYEQTCDCCLHKAKFKFNCWLDIWGYLFVM